MRGHDAGDDRQPQPGAFAAGMIRAAMALDQFGQPLGRQPSAAVLHPQARAGASDHRDGATGRRHPQRIFDEVAQRRRDRLALSHDRRDIADAGQRQALVGRNRAGRHQADDVGADILQPDAVADRLGHALRLDPREQHQLVDQPAHRDHLGAQTGRVGMVEPVQFQRQHGERRAQFMCDIGGERFMVARRLVELAEQAIDRLGEGHGLGREGGMIDQHAPLMTFGHLQLSDRLPQWRQRLSDHHQAGHAHRDDQHQDRQDHMLEQFAEGMAGGRRVAQRGEALPMFVDDEDQQQRGADEAHDRQADEEATGDRATRGHAAGSRSI